MMNIIPTIKYFKTPFFQIVLMSQEAVFLAAGSSEHVHVTATETVKALTTALISSGPDCGFFFSYVAFLYNTLLHYFHFY